MRKKFTDEKEIQVFKKLFSYEDVSFNREEGKLILDVLEREKPNIKNDLDLSYINDSIDCLKKDNYLIDIFSRSGLRQNLYSIFNGLL